MLNIGFYTVLFLFLSAGVTGNVLAQNAPSDHFREGYELLQRYDTQRAIERFEQGLKLEPTNALAHYYLAEALWLSARPEEAREHYEQSLKLDANSDVAELARKKLQANAAPTKKPASTQNAQDGSVTIPPLSCQITTCNCEYELNEDGKKLACSAPSCDIIAVLDQGPTTWVAPSNPARQKYGHASWLESKGAECSVNEYVSWATPVSIEVRLNYQCTCDQNKGCKDTYYQYHDEQNSLSINRTSGVISVEHNERVLLGNFAKPRRYYWKETTERGQGKCTPATAENRKF